MTNQRPEKQHYISQGYLLNFCEVDKQGNKRFSVYDLKHGKWRIGQPKNEACLRDFQRINHIDGIDPFFYEKALAKLESEALLVIKQILASGQLPNSFDELSLVVNLAALFGGRNYYSIRKIDEVDKAKDLSILDDAVKDKMHYEHLMQQLISEGIIEEPSSYEDAKEFIERRQFILKSQQPLIDASFQFERIMKITSNLAEVFLQLNWGLIEASASFFVTSNKPVSDICSRKAFLYERSRDILAVMPLSPRYALIGWLLPINGVKKVDGSIVEAINYSTIYKGADYIYSKKQIALPITTKINLYDQLHCIYFNY